MVSMLARHDDPLLTELELRDADDARRLRRKVNLGQVLGTQLLDGRSGGGTTGQSGVHRLLHGTLELLLRVTLLLVVRCHLLLLVQKLFVLLLLPLMPRAELILQSDVRI